MGIPCNLRVVRTGDLPGATPLSPRPVYFSLARPWTYMCA